MISERIDIIIKYLEMNPTSFSKAIGINNNVTIGRIINDKKSPSFEVLQKIIQQYSSVINTDWLITGQGNMLVQEEARVKLKKVHSTDVCNGCIDKERIIVSLEKNGELLEKLNKSLESKIKTGSGGADPVKAT